MHIFVASDLGLHYLPKSHYKECLLDFYGPKREQTT